MTVPKAMEKLFQFMFIKQCNALNKNLPELFEKQMTMQSYF